MNKYTISRQLRRQFGSSDTFKREYMKGVEEGQPGWTTDPEAAYSFSRPMAFGITRILNNLETKFAFSVFHI